VIGLARVVTILVGATALAVPARSLADVPVTVEFSGSGTYSTTNMPGEQSQTSSTVALDWTSTFPASLAQDGTLTPTALGTLTKGPGTFTFSDPSFNVSCSGEAPIAASATPPSLQVSGSTITVQSATAFDSDGSSGGYASCQGTAPGSGDPFDGSGEAASDVGVINPYLPDVLSARVQLPSLLGGQVTVPVTNADAPAQLPASCADQFGDDACNMSLSWSGTITVTPACGTVTFSDGGALPVGSVIQAGQPISTGKGQRLEITFIDGSLARFGPESQGVCQFGAFQQGERKITLKLILGNIWAVVSDALGGNPDFNVSTERAGTGVRGSEYTLDVRGKDPIAHVIEGTGFVQYAGRPEFDYPAGLSAVIGKKSATLTSRWPAADRALVPAGKRPPTLTRLRLSGPKGRPGARLGFRLDQKCSLTLQLLKGNKVVSTKKLRGRKGKNSFHPFKRRLRRGRYTLRVTAVAHTRASAGQISFKA
jgi:FecR protein